MSLTELVARTGLLEAEIRKSAASTDLIQINSPQFWLLDRKWAAARVEAMHEALKEFHRRNPLLAGLSKEEMRGKQLPGAPPWLLDALLGSAKTIVAEGETVRLRSHKIALQQDEADASTKIENAFRAAGLTVPSVQEVLAKSGVEPSRARNILQLLLRDKKLVRVSDELVFHPAALESLRELLAKRKGHKFAVPEFKDWTGVSRKYAIPLLEFLDRERVTRRDGDTRVVL
jgi:selenocysteine-specific elongation factor